MVKCMYNGRLIVSDEDEGIRIDKFLAENLEDITRNRIQKLIDDSQITVNDKIIKANYKVRENDIVNIIIPDAVEINIEAEDIPLDIVYEDEDLLVVNKPKGMVVHPAPGHYTGTLVNAIMYHCKDNLSGINGELRPGIVHRIDMDTTGLLVVCKNDYAHNFLAEQLKEHSITRKYHAIVYNSVRDDDGTVNAPLGRNPSDRKKMAIVKDGREAITHYHVIDRFKNFSYIECQLETGRTHQIRVHMTSINHPLLGDELYGPKSSNYNLQGQTLHAKVLGFIHPRTKEYMEFEVPLPEYFQKLINILKNK